MKKWMVSVLIIVFAAAMSVADGHSPWWKFGFGGNDDGQVQAEKADLSPKAKRSDGQADRHRPQLSKEQREKVRTKYEAVQQLAEAVRKETDPVKKEELTDQLHAMLIENAKKMQEQFRKRVEKAEMELVKMKERLDQGETNMEQRVQAHLQKLLAGEKVGRQGGPKDDRQDGQRHKKKQPEE